MFTGSSRLNCMAIKGSDSPKILQGMGMHFKTLLVVFSSSLILSCDTTVNHVVLASDAWLSRDNIQIVSQERTDGLTLRHVLWDCPEGYVGKQNQLEFDGYFGDKSAQRVNNLLDLIEPCSNDVGDTLQTLATLNGRGGDFLDGASIGHAFREHNVKTHLLFGQTCKASCAAAFLGGINAEMSDDTALSVYVPFEAQYEASLDCANPSEITEVKQYLSSMLMEPAAAQFMKVLEADCLVSKGQTFDQDKARNLGLAMDYTVLDLSLLNDIPEGVTIGDLEKLTDLAPGLKVETRGVTEWHYCSTNLAGGEDSYVVIYIADEQVIAVHRYEYFLEFGSCEVNFRRGPYFDAPEKVQVLRS